MERKCKLKEMGKEMGKGKGKGKEKGKGKGKGTVKGGKGKGKGKVNLAFSIWPTPFSNQWNQVHIDGERWFDLAFPTYVNLFRLV